MSMAPLTKQVDGDNEREETSPSTARRAIVQVVVPSYQAPPS